MAISHAAPGQVIDLLPSEMTGVRVTQTLIKSDNLEEERILRHEGATGATFTEPRMLDAGKITARL